MQTHTARDTTHTTSLSLMANLARTISLYLWWLALQVLARRTKRHIYSPWHCHLEDRESKWDYPDWSWLTQNTWQEMETKSNGPDAWTTLNSRWEHTTWKGPGLKPSTGNATAMQMINTAPLWWVSSVWIRYWKLLITVTTLSVGSQQGKKATTLCKIYQWIKALYTLKRVNINTCNYS